MLKAFADPASRRVVSAPPKTHHSSPQTHPPSSYGEYKDVFKRLIIIGWLLVAVTLTPQAQSNWTAWLYTPSDGGVTRVSATGEIVDAFRLPLSQAFNAYGPAALVSSSGRFIAYTAEDTTSGFENRLLMVYDTRADIIRFTYDLTGVDALDFERQIHPTAFDENSQTFAFGLVRDGSWELVLADLTTESVKGGGAFTEAASGLSGGLPMIMQVQGERVIFYLLGINTQFSREYQLYRWQPGDTPSPFGLTSAFADIQNFGDLVMPYHDETLPAAGASDGPVLAYNAVEIHPTSGGTLRLTDTADLDIMQTWWIAGGQQVLIRGFDEAVGTEVLEVVNLDGTVIGQFQITLGDLHGTPDGLVGIFASGGGVGLGHVATLSGEFPTRTVYTTADPSARLVLVVGG